MSTDAIIKLVQTIVGLLPSIKQIVMDLKQREELTDEQYKALMDRIEEAFQMDYWQPKDK